MKPAVRSCVLVGENIGVAKQLKNLHLMHRVGLKISGRKTIVYSLSCK